MLGNTLVSRAPYGARGLKYVVYKACLETVSSRPVWGAWIEMLKRAVVSLLLTRRAPYGARGLKFTGLNNTQIAKGVAPRMGRVD